MKKHIIFILILVMFLSGCGTKATSTPTMTTEELIDSILKQVDESENIMHSVQYVVISQVWPAALTYANNQGGTVQEKIGITDRSGWKKTYTMMSGDFMYISAQVNGEGGYITCQIYIDGVKEKETESSGDYVICDASGSVP